MGFTKLVFTIGLFSVATRLVLSQDETSCFCTEEQKEICGTNNQTYGNPCKLDCYNTNNPGSCKINKARNVACKAGCACTKIYAPVRGSDNKNYDNACTLYCYAIENNKPCLSVARNGTCDSNTTTTSTVEAD